MFSVVARQAVAQSDPYFLQSHFNGENGLPQNTIRDMLLSSSGYLWMATENGLVRFDGLTPITYNIQNSPLKKDRVTQLIKTGDGKLYCLTEDYSLYEIIESPPFIYIRFLEQIPHKVFNGYSTFAAPTIAAFLNICKASVPENNLNPNQQVFFTIKKGSLIAQRSNEGLLIMGQDLQIKRKVPIPNLYRCDLFVYNELLYLRNEKGFFFRVDAETGELIAQKVKQQGNAGSNLIKATTNDGLYWNEKTSDVFWVSNRQLYTIRIEQNNVVPEKIFSGLPDCELTRIMYSHDGLNIIVGTLSEGFFVYHKKQFSTILASGEKNIYYAQAPVYNRRTVLTLNGLELGDGYQNKIAAVGQYDRTSLCTDLKGRIWFCANYYLKSFDPVTNTVKTHIYVPEAAGSGIFVIANYDSSSLLLATWGSLFYYKIDSGIKKLADFKSTKRHKQPLCILKEADSIIWVGSYDGVYRYNIQSGQMEHNTLNDLIVRSLYRTSSGLLLAGTYGNGMYVITKDKTIPLPLDKNKCLETAHWITEDKSGFIWISSNSGLFKIALKEIDDYVAAPKTSLLYYYRFSNTDGLLTNEFNGGCFPAAVAVDSSTWSFPSMKGLVWFKPDSVKTAISHANVYIDKILLNDVAVSAAKIDTIFTQTHRFKLSVYLSSPNWSDQNNLEVEYRLAEDTLTGNWIPVNDINIPVVLQNLPGGYHQLIIRKRTGVGKADFKEVKLIIKVPLLLQEHIWFWPAIVITALLLMLGIDRFSHYLIRQKKEKLQRLVDAQTVELKGAVQLLEEQNLQIKKSEASLKKESEFKSSLLFLLSHDIASPLRFINMFLSGFMRQSKPVPIADMELYDLKIATGNLENLLDNIVLWIKNSNEKSIDPIITAVDLHQLVKEKIALFELVIKKKNNRVQNNIPTNIQFYTDRFIVAMALQNLLGNAINYTENGHIEIGYAETAEAYEISVTDSGLGINSKLAEEMTKNDPSQMNNETGHLLQGYGIGLKITSELLRLINGRLTLTPVKNGRGTMAVLSITKGNHFNKK